MSGSGQRASVAAPPPVTGVNTIAPAILAYQKDVFMLCCGQLASVAAALPVAGVNTSAPAVLAHPPNVSMLQKN